MMTTAQRKTFSGDPTRKREVVIREPNGRAQRPPKPVREANVMEVVLNQPHRKPFGLDAKSQKAESVFGRMSLTKEITERQYRAGEDWLHLFIRHAAVTGIPMPSFPSALAQRIAGAVDNREEDLERIDAVRRAYEDMNAYLSDKLPGEYVAAQRALMSVLVLNHRPDMMKMGALRTALNRLADFWKYCEARA